MDPAAPSFLGGPAEAVALYGSLTLLTLYALLCCVPFTHNAVRAALRPTVLRYVEGGMSSVVWAQRFRHPLLTRAFNASAHTVSVQFYVTVLPFCIWIFGDSLGWRLCFLMTASLYVGNSLKDLFGAPRPFSLAAAKAGSEAAALLADHDSEDFRVHAKEYGLPSSHTMNTLALNFYIVHHLVEQLAPGPTLAAALYGTALAWVLWIAFSRLYLGFHTPIDIYVGAVYGAVLLLLYTHVDDLLDGWLVSSKLSGMELLAVLVVLLRLHPRPLTYTPSFEYTVSFAGVSFGIAASMRRASGFLPYLREAPALLTVWGTFFALRRLATGMVVLFIMKEACKTSLLGMLPLLYRCFPPTLRRLWQPPLVSLCLCQGRPSCSHAQVPINGKGQPWDADITARFFAYASIGWAVIELAPRMFSALGW